MGLPTNVSEWTILSDSARKAGQGGLAGAAAMAVTVCSLMWTKTTINYQYRHGTTTTTALRTLYNNGGIIRLYSGFLPALIQGPLSRFVDTSANAGTMTALNAFHDTANMSIASKTMVSSVIAGVMRIVIMPLDTLKTAMQVEGKTGLPKLIAKYRANGIGAYYHGSLAAAAATLVGHYPWFLIHNYLSEVLPKQTDFIGKMKRNAFIGFCSSVVSDTCSNSFKVVKVYKQANTESISYPEAVRRIIHEGGIYGLFGRGLKSRIMASAMQSVLFTVLWKYFDEMLSR